MCRSIRQLRRAEDGGPATTGEAHAAALQYVRKVSGFRAPSVRHHAAFDAAVEEVAAATARLLAAIGTDVADGPDPFADPVTRRAILDARPTRGRGAARGGSAGAPSAERTAPNARQPGAAEGPA
jgi:hypothetical protein